MNEINWESEADSAFTEGEEVGDTFDEAANQVYSEGASPPPNLDWEPVMREFEIPNERLDRTAQPKKVKLVDKKETLKKFAEKIDINLDIDAPAVGFYDRWRYSISPKFKDVHTKFMKDNPDGGMYKMSVPGFKQPQIVAKRDLEDKSEPFRMINPAGFDSGDIAEHLEDIAVIGTQASMPYTLPLRGAGILKNAAWLGVVGNLPKVATDLHQEFMGYSPDWNSTILDMGIDSVAGGVVSKFEGKNIKAGLTPEQTQEFSGQAMRNAQLQEGTPLPATASSNNKIAERIANQSAGTSNVIQDAKDRAHTIYGEILRNMTRQVPEEYTVDRTGDIVHALTPQDALGKVLKENAGELIEKRLKPGKDKITAAMNVGATSKEKAGLATKARIEKWRVSTRDVLSDDYEAAWDQLSVDGVSEIQVSDNTFDIADEILGAIDQKLPPGASGSVSDMDGDLKRLAFDIKNWKQQGVGGVVTEVPSDRVGPGIPYSRIVDYSSQPVDTIKRFRTRLFNIAESGTYGVSDVSSKYARQLHASLAEDIATSAGGTRGGKMWERANANWKERDGRLKKEVVQNAARTEEPHKFVREFLSDPDPTAIDSLKKVSSGRLDEIQDAYLTHLRQNPKDLDSWINKLEGMGNNAHRRLVNDKQLEALKTTATAYRMMQGHPYQAMLDAAADWGHMVTSLMDDGLSGPRFMNDIIKDLGGHGSAGHQLLKAGVADALLMKFSRNRFGNHTLDLKAFTSAMNGWQNGATRGTFEALFSPLEMAKLRNIDIMTQYFMRGPDMGASLESASLVSDLKKFSSGNPVAGLRAIHDLYVNKTAGMILMSDSMNKWLLAETAVPPKSYEFMKAFAVTANDTVRILNQYGLSQSEEAAYDPNTDILNAGNMLRKQEQQLPPVRSPTYQEATGDYSPVQ